MSTIFDIIVESFDIYFLPQYVVLLFQFIHFRCYILYCAIIAHDFYSTFIAGAGMGDKILKIVLIFYYVAITSIYDLFYIKIIFGMACALYNGK